MIAAAGDGRASRTYQSSGHAGKRAVANRYSFSDEQLFRIKPEEYNEKYIDHLIDQYKLYVQSHEKISEGREGSNRFFLTLNSAVVGGIVALINSSAEKSAIVIIIASSALAICLFWRQALKSYSDLNTGKFKVIHAIERRLPLALYESEWRVLGRGKDPELYKPISHLEAMIPWAFIVLYASILIWKFLLF